MDAAREVCARLQSWPTSVASDLRSVVRESLEQCCVVFESRRAILAWEEGEEPWLFMACWSGGELSWREEDASRFGPLVDPALQEEAFRTAADGALLDREGTPQPAVSSLFRAEFQVGALITAPAIADSVQGRLFIEAPGIGDGTLLILAQSVGLLVASRMEFVISQRQAIREAIAEERIRVARDLHDGLLQSFTGIVLQLETIHNILDTQPVDARRMITDAQGMIMSDQRELRAYVEQLRPRMRREMAFDFTERLTEFRARFESQWGIRLHFDVEKMDPLVAQSLGQETFRLIHEAVTNSAKHGAASEVRVRLGTDHSQMRIEIADNGSGFPFHGRRTLEEIRRSGSGPSMLADRVASLNGDLSVQSSEAGATIEISVPLGWSGA